MVTPPTTTQLGFKAEELPIKSVTVFRPSGAQIVRVLKANLKVRRDPKSAEPVVLIATQAGNNLLEITGLSSTTDTESLRVTGLGNARLLVLVCNFDSYPDIPESDPIRAAQKELTALRAETDARLQQLELLSGYGKSLADKKNVTPEDATAFASQLVKRTIENKQAIRDLEAKIEVQSRWIERTQQEKQGTAQSKASVTIVAEEDGPVELHVSYRELCFCSELLATFKFLVDNRCLERTMVSCLRSTCWVGEWETISLSLPPVSRRFESDNW